MTDLTNFIGFTLRAVRAVDSVLGWVVALGLSFIGIRAFFDIVDRVANSIISMFEHFTGKK